MTRVLIIMTVRRSGILSIKVMIFGRRFWRRFRPDWKRAKMEEIRSQIIHDLVEPEDLIGLVKEHKKILLNFDNITTGLKRKDKE